jgi:hypothetical protein
VTEERVLAQEPGETSLTDQAPADSSGLRLGQSLERTQVCQQEILKQVRGPGCPGQPCPSAVRPRRLQRLNVQTINWLREPSRTAECQNFGQTSLNEIRQLGSRLTCAGLTTHAADEDVHGICLAADGLAATLPVWVGLLCSPDRRLQLDAAGGRPATRGGDVAVLRQFRVLIAEVILRLPSRGRGRRGR